MADANTAAGPAAAAGPAVVAGWRGLLGGLYIDALQWTLGLFCAFLGAFLLVAPHQFSSAPYAGFLANPSGWGLVSLLCGAAMLSIPTLRPRRPVRAAVHGAVGLVLLLLAVGFWLTAAVTGGIVYTLLGLATLLAVARPRGRWRRRRPSAPTDGDLLCLVVGLATSLNGALMLFLPGLLTRGFYPPGQRWLPYFGVLWLATGPPLVFVQLRRVPPRLAAVVHLAAGLSLVVFGVMISVPGRLWTGVALYCGGGLTVAVLPWLRRRFARADPTALRTRLALALALTASVALILAVAVVTSQEQRLAEEQAIATQEGEARAIAQNVADYLEFNLGRIDALALRAASLPPTAAARQDLLERAALLDPDVTALALLRRSGEVLARSPGFPLSAAGARALAAEVRGDTMVLRFLDVGERRLVLMNAPLSPPAGRNARSNGGVKGVLVAVLNADSLHRRLERADSRVQLADGRGRVIAVLDRLSAHALATERDEGPLPLGWDRDVVAGRAPALGRSLAGFAAVPDFGWAVAVERERSAALAGMRRGRDLAFLLLLVLVGLAVTAGTLIGRRIARPLGALAGAVAEMSAGGSPELAAAPGSAAPLPESGVTELARLSAAFRDLRARLAARTAESERLAGELRARAEALAEADRRKDEFLAMLAHELRNPLGAIANASYVLEQRSTAPSRGGAAGGGHPAPDPAPGAHGRRPARRLAHHARQDRAAARAARPGRGDPAGGRGHRSRPSRRGATSSRSACRRSRSRSAADRTRLEQVVSNLLHNAAKFTAPGGRIEVDVERERARRRWSRCATTASASRRSCCRASSTSSPRASRRSTAPGRPRHRPHPGPPPGRAARRPHRGRKRRPRPRRRVHGLAATYIRPMTPSVTVRPRAKVADSSPTPM